MKGTMGRCRVCGLALDLEHPDAVYGRNPVTFRMGWMHGVCARVAYEELEGESARDAARFVNRKDEYDQIVADRGG